MLWLRSFLPCRSLQAADFGLGENVVVGGHHIGDLDAALFGGYLRHFGLDGVNDVQLVRLGRIEAPEVAHVHNGEVAAHIAGVNLRRVQGAVLNQA